MQTRVYICKADSSRAEEIFSRYVPELSLYRRGRAMKFSDRRKAVQSIAAGVLLDRALSEHGLRERDMEYGFTAHGKPVLCGYPEICFNLSHSGSVAVCSISQSSVGCDAEMNRAVNMGIIRKYFSDSEREYVLGSDNTDEAFMRIWTRKESVVKADGCGISGGFGKFSVLGSSVLFGGCVYHLHEYKFENAVISCACADKAFEPEPIIVQL